jgi:tetratricopeptide (TPR) repeat protein
VFDQKYPKKLLSLTFVSIFIITLVVYLSLLPNFITGYADSDELITVAKILGVAHPPSYPLYTLLAALIGRLPIPFLTFAGKVNFLSSILSAATASFFFLSNYFLLEKIVENFWVRLTVSSIGAFSLAFSFSFFFFALFAEVFSLHLFLLSLVVFLLILWNKNRNQKILLLVVFFSGLGISNQQVFLFFLPLFAFWVLVNKIKVFLDWKFLSKGIVLFLLGFLLPYLYLPLAAQNQAVINWENPKDLISIYRVITRRAYAETQPQGQAYLGGKLGVKEISQGLIDVSVFLIKNFNFLFFFLALVGGLYLLKKKQYKIFLFLILGLFFGGYFFGMYSPTPNRQGEMDFYITKGTHERFFLTTLPFFALFISFGVLGIYQMFKAPLKKFKIILLFFPFLFVFFLAATNYQEIKNNNFSLGYKYGTALLSSLKKDAILLCFAEQTCFTTTYLQQVEGIRKDILIIPGDFAQWPADQIKEKYPNLIKTTATRITAQHSILLVRDLLRFNIGKRPIYAAGLNGQKETFSLYSLFGDPFYLIPYGCSLEISRVFKFQKQPESCYLVGKEALETYVTTRAPIARMFKDFLSFQHFVNGYVYEMYGCPKEAQIEFKRSLELAPFSKKSKEELKKLEKGPIQKNCKTVKDPPVATDLIAKGAAAETLGDLKNALYFFGQVLSINPENIDIRFKTASIYQKTGYFYMAKVEYQDILIIDPENKIAKKGLDELKNLEKTKL